MNLIKISHTAWSEEDLQIATTIPVDEVELTLGEAISTWRNEGKDYNQDDMIDVLRAEHPEGIIKRVGFTHLIIHHA